MIETIKVNIDGMDFSIQQFNFNEAFELEAITLSILAPALNVFKKFNGFDDEVELDSLGQVLQSTLFSLRKENPFEYVKNMVRNTFYHDKTEVQLNNDKAINTVFHGKTLSMMKLLLEVMKVNKFAFIEGLGGNGMNVIGILSGVKTDQKKNLKN